MKSNRSLTIKSHPRHQAEVRQLSEMCAAESGVPEETTFKLVLAVDEAITNIIRHAYGGDENQEIILRAESTPDTIEFRLRDFGRQADPRPSNLANWPTSAPAGSAAISSSKVFDTVTYDINFPRGD
jgi:anti-sigma regulatory factor (Ser/Thr protein kinase)